jgi:hypothetical protein
MKKSNLIEPMKPALISFKTTPEIKEILEKLAEEGFRSLSAQIEMIVIKYLEEQGIEVRKSKK